VNLQTLPTAGRPGHATSTSPASPLGADPDPGPCLRHRGASSTGQQVGLGRRDRWRRTGGFIDQSPGRRQGTTILVPTAARHYCPAADLVGLGTFWNEDATSGSREARDQRRDRYVTSDAAEVWPRRDSEGRLKRAWRHVPHRSTATSVAQASVRERATPVWRAVEAWAAGPAS